MRHVLFAFVAAILFGTTGTAQALGPEGASSLSVGSVRIVVGGAALALIAWLLTRRSPSALRESLDHAASVAAPRRRTWPVVAAGAAAIVVYQPAFFLGTSINGVAIGTLVAIGSGPIFTGALEWVLRRRFPGFAWLAATIIAIVGISLLSGIGASGSTEPVGLLLSLTAGACYAFYALSAKQLLLDGWTPTGSVALIFGWSAVGAIPFLVFSDLRWLLSVEGVVMALWLGLVTITVACLFLAFGLKALTASTVSTLGLGEPFMATLLGVVVLHEVLNGRELVGLALVVFGLVLIGSLRARRPVPA